MRLHFRYIAFAFAAVVGPLAATSQTPSSNSSFDRKQPPSVPPAAPLTFPKAQQRTLKNGIPITIMEDHSRPVVSVSTVVRISSLAEPPGKTRIRSFVANLMGDGTTKHTADQLADEFAVLGNSVSPTGFYTITANVDRSLELMAEQFLSPAFPQTELDLQKADLGARLERAKENPGYIANRIMAKNLYGKDHPYAREVTAEDIKSITRDDIIQFYRDYYRPPNIKVVVAGDITPDQAVEKLNRVFGDLTPGKEGDLRVPPVAPVGATTIYLYDRPGSQQSVVNVAQLGPQRDTPDQYAIEVMNTALGGAFNSRLNLNLREQHQYAYGANSGFNFRRPPEPSTFMAGAQVATAKTDSSLIEIMKEINGIRDVKTVTPDEVAFGKASATKVLPLQFETIDQRANAVAGLVVSDQPLDYYNTIIQKYEAVSIDQTRDAAKKYLTPDKMVIVVVGDRKAIEAGVKATNLAPVVVVDSF